MFSPKIRFLSRALGAGIQAALILLLCSQPHAASGAYQTNILTVCPNGCDHTSLQAAITAASPGDTIQLATTESHTEYDIVVNKDLTIEGLGGTFYNVIQASDSYGSAPNRVFYIQNGVTVRLQYLRIQYGVSSAGAGIYNDGGTVELTQVEVALNKGSGILNQGQMTINDSKILDNRGGTNGGGIHNLGTLHISHATISGNEGLQSGGGIENYGNLNIYESAIRDNHLEWEGHYTGYGAGIYNAGMLNIAKSTIESNYMEGGIAGGGIYAAGTEQLNQVTLRGNHGVAAGGGMYVCSNGRVNLANVTITGNIADADQNDSGTGGGLYILGPGYTNVVRMRNSIVAGNRELTSGLILDKAPECFGKITSEGYNLVGWLGKSGTGTACTIVGDPTGNIIGQAAELSPLADNGGPTNTHALMSSSPAVDAGDPNGCYDHNQIYLSTDQRGGLRADRCDIGAFELDALTEHLFLPLALR